MRRSEKEYTKSGKMECEVVVKDIQSAQNRKKLAEIQHIEV